MERISLIERKTNEKVLRTVKKKRNTFVGAIKVRRFKMIEYAPRRSEEMHNIIIEGTLKKRELQSVLEIKNNARAKTFKGLEEKASNRIE